MIFTGFVKVSCSSSKSNCKKDWFIKYTSHHDCSFCFFSFLRYFAELYFSSNSLPSNALSNVNGCLQCIQASTRPRSEERSVGKECRSWVGQECVKKRNKVDSIETPITSRI